MTREKWTIKGPCIVDDRGKFVANFAREHGDLLVSAPELRSALALAIQQIEALCSPADVPDECRAALARARARARGDHP